MHIKENIAKANEGIGIVPKLEQVLPRESLVIIYKSFIRPHIDHGESYMTIQIMNLFVI